MYSSRYRRYSSYSARQKENKVSQRASTHISVSVRRKSLFLRLPEQEVFIPTNCKLRTNPGNQQISYSKKQAESSKFNYLLKSFNEQLCSRAFLANPVKKGNLKMFLPLCRFQSDLNFFFFFWCQETASSFHRESFTCPQTVHRHLRGVRNFTLQAGAPPPLSTGTAILTLPHSLCSLQCPLIGWQGQPRLLQQPLRQSPSLHSRVPPFCHSCTLPESCPLSTVHGCWVCFFNRSLLIGALLA